MRRRTRLPKACLFLLLILFVAAGFLIPLWPFAGVPVSGAAPLYEGFHDSVDCNYVAGWVWDKNSPGTRLSVSVYDTATGAVVATGTANQFRQDLVNAGKGDGFYGFWIATPASVKDGVTHSLGVKVTGTSFNLGNTPKSFNSSTSGCTVTGPVTMTVLTRTPESRHANYRVQSTGFSVSYTSNKYHVYGTGGYDGWRWTSDYTGWDSLPGCYYATDPRVWPARCTTDGIGYFWKLVSCPAGGGVACQANNRWNASPGLYNLTTFASPSVWPNPPTADYGTQGYSPIIIAGKVNAVAIEPASTDCLQTADTVWVDDTLPDGATPYADVDTWKWAYPSPSPTPYPVGPGATPEPSPTPVSPANPTFPPPPFPSFVSHQSADYDLIHQHYFLWATHRLEPGAGDKLFAYVYINPASPPQEIMLQWHSVQEGWNHRAFWGADLIAWGVSDPMHQSHRRVSSAVPTAGQWVRLEVPASLVGLEGKSVNGMAFTLFDGQATWDRAGKSKPLPGSKCPPKTWTSAEKSFHAYNRDDFATGAANGKAQQVKYAGGQTRWFMAFNKMVKYVSTTYRRANPNYPNPNNPNEPPTIPYNHSQYGATAADNWQVMWATSNDGANWTVDKQMLFRSASELQYPAFGALVTDMFVDNGYFYILFQDLVKPYQYLARAPVNTVYSTADSGYVGGWSIACNPLQANGDYTWKSFTPGARLDFEQMGAYQVMRTHVGWEAGGFVKQGTIARVFSSTTPGKSAYFGVTNDAWGPLQLWKTSSLSKPFQYESDVVIEDPTFKAGAFGWEMGFTHHADNTPASPRILSAGFDWWMTEDLRAQSPTHASIDGWVVITRHTARLAGF